MSRIQLRRDTAANWIAANPTLAAGEVGIEYTADPSTAEKFKIGDGTTAWTSLPYVTGSGGGGGTPDPHAASHADGGSDEISIDASQITTGTIADARIPAAITRDTELAAHEADTTAVHGIADTSALALSSSVILKSFVDAKGDIITATANDTPARLAVGSDGQVLTADSAQSSGVKWATPAGGGSSIRIGPTIPAVNDFLSPATVATQNYAFPLDSCGFIPVLINVDMSVDALGIYIATAGSAGSVVRLGLYSDNSTTGKPANVLAQATVDGTVSARAFATFSAVSLTAGWYWLATANQVAAATLVCTASGTPHQRVFNTVPYAGVEPGSLWIATGISGAFANNPTVTRTIEAPWSCVRRSA